LLHIRLKLSNWVTPWEREEMQGIEELSLWLVKGRRGEAILLLAGTAGCLDELHRPLTGYVLAEQREEAVQFTALRRRQRRLDKLPWCWLEAWKKDGIHTAGTSN
jgi:hypothetical protein